MELLELKTIEETEEYIFFKVKIEYRTFWGRKKIEWFDCVNNKRHKNDLNTFLSNGEKVYVRWLYLDNIINPILTTKSRIYKRQNEGVDYIKN